MKKIIVYFVIAFVIFFIMTFILGLQDDIFREQFYTGIWYKDIFSSLKYYFLWVLPYWWLLILVGTIVLGFIFYFIKIGLGKLKGS